MSIHSEHVTIRDIGELPLLAQSRALAIPDFLGRKLHATFPIVSDPSSTAVVALAGDEPIAWMRFHPRRLLLHRDQQTISRLMPAALLEFPVTERFVPEVWSALFDHVLGKLFLRGAPWAAVYLPPECTRHCRFLFEQGFRRLAECDSESVVRSVGFDRTSTLWIRHSAVARGSLRPDMYPYLADAAMLYSADVATAPDPDAAFWSQALIYSGYSGYPFLTDVFRTFIPSHTRTILSVPCATGDLFRLLPTELLSSLEGGIGVDIMPRNVDFARTRVRFPHLDPLNMMICHAFLRHRVGLLNVAPAEFLREMLNVCGRPADPDEIGEYYLQMQAAFAEVILSGAITDWFALLKGLGRLLTVSPEPDIFRVNVPEDGFAFCRTLAERISPAAVREFLARIRSDELLDEIFLMGDLAASHFANGRIQFIEANMFEMDLQRLFDCVFVWEAALMVVGSGLEERFLERLDQHLASGGTMILTGLRSEQHDWPRELKVSERLLAGRGYRTVLTAITPRPAKWAMGYVPPAWFPTLVAQKS